MPEPSAPRIRPLVWTVPLLAIGALVGWRFELNHKSDSGGAVQGGPKTPVVRVVTVQSKDIAKSIQTVGNVVSPLKVEVSPKISGRILYLVAREGDPVKPGDLLLSVDPSDLKDAVIQQQASLAEAQSRLAQAQLTTNATNVGVTSQISQQAAAVTSAKASLNQAEESFAAQVATAQGQITAAQAAVTTAQATLEEQKATLKNVQAHLERTQSLYTKGYLASQDLGDAQTAVDVQKGVVKVSQGQLESAKAQLDVQNQNLTIVKKTGEAAIATSKAQLAQAEAALEVAKANRSQTPAYQQNIAALKSQVDSMVAQLGQARARLQDTIIKSAISGTVTARNADPGGLATPGTPVLEVQFMDWLYVRASVPIEDGALVRKGELAEVKIDALPGRTFSGPIVNINSAADPQSRQFGVDVRLDNPGHVIRPGMFANVSITTYRVHADAVVPQEALTTDASGRTTIAVVDQNDIAHIIPVALGLRDDKEAQVLTGVHSGEKVVVLTFNPLKDGQKVVLGLPGLAGTTQSKGGGTQ